MTTHSLFAPTETATYAWIIDHDHLSAEDGETGAVGTAGPAHASDELLARLDNGHGHVFRLYDDDGELYYTGRGIWIDHQDEPDEDAAYGPLGDFGLPFAGCTSVRWAGHHEWDCC